MPPLPTPTGDSTPGGSHRATPSQAGGMRADTLGKRLAKARIEQGLSIDDAAYSTKMRPDKIVALENDDYSRFGNNAYAKGFLLIYGRFLGVDVTEQARTLEPSDQLRVSDYQYLSNAPTPEPEPVRVARPGAVRKPSLVPLAVFALCVVALVFGFYLYVSFQRLGSLDRKSARDSLETPATSANPLAPPAPTPFPVAPKKPLPVAEATPRLEQPPVVEVRRAEPIRAVPPPATPSSALPVINEIVVEPLKKTWVKISRDDPNSPPIFMDYLYPSAGPLKLRGSRFFIEARDPDAIQIRKNGTPIAYQPGVTIQ